MHIDKGGKFKTNSIVGRHASSLIALLLASFTNASSAYVFNDGWVPITTDTTLTDPKSLEISPNSILDFTTLRPTVAITSEGQRLMINSEGKFARKSNLASPLKFLIASPSFDIRTNGFPSKADIDRHIKQYKMHGYNMVRFHFIEYLLMYKQKQDFGFLNGYVKGDDSQLDRFFYYVSQLKSNGIYLLVDGLSAPNGGYGDTSLNGYYWDRYLDQKGLKHAVYFDPVAQQHWRDLVKAMYGTVNPYTQKTLFQDPVLAGLVLVNENNLINESKFMPELNQQFSSWLLNKYGSQAVLVAAWGATLVGTQSLEDGTVTISGWSDVPSKKMADTQQFFIEVQKNTADWMTAYVKGLGYNGSITSYHFFYGRSDHQNRAQFNWIDMHNYFAGEFYVDGKYSIPQSSMLGGDAWYIQVLASTKNIGKPFTVSEHGQVAWNQYRRESGLALPAYAAFQDWSGICQHSNSIQLSYAPITDPKLTLVNSYSVGFDPISRATETLSALLYLRGDVKSANSSIGAKFTTAETYANSYWQETLPSDVTKLGLITGLGLDLDDAQRTKVTSGLSTTQYTAQVDVNKPGQMTVYSSAGNIALNNPPVENTWQAYWAARVENLKAANLLGLNNKTNVADSVYHSDTEQLLLERNKKQMTVNTPKTEGLVFDALPEPITINNLSVKSADAGALVSVSAMDVNSNGVILSTSQLATSKRMLVVLSTDAQNSGMSFLDDKGATLENLGTQPILIKPVKVSLSLKNSNSLNLKLYSVDLRGKRRDVLPLTKTGCNATATRAATKCTGIDFDLDITKLTHGATPYFEIATN